MQTQARPRTARTTVAPDAYREPPADAAAVKVLHPGDLACGERGDRLETLLGSCVAILLCDPRRTTAALCHVVHAGHVPPGRPGAGERDTVYGEAALAEMKRRLMWRGIQPALCEAWVVGGGNMFPGLVRGRHVGQTNADWALAALAREGIRVVHQDLGGTAYRKLSWTVGPDEPRVEAIPV
jgi:chemotaxis protein CheD